MIDSVLQQYIYLYFSMFLSKFCQTFALPCASILNELIVKVCNEHESECQEYVSTLHHSLEFWSASEYIYLLFILAKTSICICYDFRTKITYCLFNSKTMKFLNTCSILLYFWFLNCDAWDSMVWRHAFVNLSNAEYFWSLG